MTMTHEGFITILDKKNPEYVSLNETIFDNPNKWRFAKKDKNLPEIVEDFLKSGHPPIIDKKLSVIIGATTHRLMRAQLYWYHTSVLPSNRWDSYELSMCADSYIAEGKGYYFSSMETLGMLYSGHKIKPIVGKLYKPDHFDKDLFLIYEPDRSY